MRRTLSVFRGVSGHGWFKKYRETPEAFEKYTQCTPFNWGEATIKRPVAYFELESGNQAFGRLEFELAEDILPRTVTNFVKLITGDNPKKFTYKGTNFHIIRKGEVIMGGDVEHTGGERSHAASEQRYFEDENFIIPHTARGLLSMASIGVNTNGSQFYISFVPTPYLNGRCMAFARLIKGEPVLERLEKLFTTRSVPANPVTIKDCGVIYFKEDDTKLIEEYNAIYKKLNANQE